MRKVSEVVFCGELRFREAETDNGRREYYSAVVHVEFAGRRNGDRRRRRSRTRPPIRMTSRSEPNGRAATLQSPRAMALAVVTVEDRVDERLSGRGGCRYTAPPQPVAKGEDLVRLLLGRGVAPADHGPWRHAIAGGQRVVRLDPWTET